MAATNYTPIQLYYSTTASAVPVNTNLAAGELAINTLDEKLYFKNSAGTVKLLASNASSSGTVSSVAASVPAFLSIAGSPITTSGTLAITYSGTALPVANGGTGLTLGTSGGVLAYTATGTLASSAALTANALVLGGGAGATPAPMASLGTTTTVLHGNAAGAPTFGAVSLTADVSGTLPIANGGTGATTLAGANIVVTNAAQTFTATQTFAGSTSVEAMKTSNIAEVDTISATAATGTINFDITTQSVLYYTSNASGNWTVNFRGSSGTSLNTLMATGESISATFLVTQGATAYYNSAVTIDGTSVTPKWQGGTAPTSGNASSVDCYTYVIQKTGSATYVVLASVTKFA